MMLTAGRSWLSYIRCVSILLALSGCAIGDGTVSFSSADCTPLADCVVRPDATCPARTWWEVEGELFQLPICPETRWGRFQESYTTTASALVSAGPGTPVAAAGVSSGSAGGEATPATEQTADHEQDTDSLLDSASFLSFEDWKKQNLAKVGQSAENVGGSRRSAAGGKEDRRQPTGINNALDSLGDDAEIELDFGGFGAETPETASPNTWATPIASRDDSQAEDADGRAEEVHLQHSAHTDASRRNDAGTTCKERFNYASFDCAATVLKTNPECKGSPSVLIENKDSYMLNECRAQNKFLILELCEDILVDTVVLANYEFFSSIFHTFRVSVSDRYPAKPDQWKELGVYEARNTREIQAFAVENSLIWARYLRIEFLTHYGHEFYCPVSLIRVHGTTMMEEYKHDEGGGRATIDEVDEPVDAGQLPGEPEAEPVQPRVDALVSDREKVPDSQAGEVCRKLLSDPEVLLLGPPDGAAETCGLSDKPSTTTIMDGTAATIETRASSNVNATAPTGDSIATTPPSRPVKAAEDTRKTSDAAKVGVTTPSSSTVASESAAQNATSETTGRAAPNPKEEGSAAPNSTRPTNTQPPSPNPTTQESFFKSVQKRLQMLESNSTLSLQYIEEQSRILRDAFNKVEKRQLSKTSTFLENLNVTVLNELKQFREQYDHVWKSVAFEFEHQRIQYYQEMQALSGQLGVLADELVFQKRVTVIQSIMVLCCFALVLFSRSSVGNYMEFPGIQRMVARSQSLRSSSPLFFSSPSASPDSTRPTSSHRDKVGHRRNLSDSSSPSEQDGPASPTVAYIPPTPTSDSSSADMEDVDHGDHPALLASRLVPTLGMPQLRPQSTPPVLSGGTGDVGTDDEAELPNPAEGPPTGPL